MKLLVLCLQSEGKWFSAGICRITLVLAGHNLTEPSELILDIHRKINLSLFSLL